MLLMTRYAIILSVEDYAEFSRTPFCHADASLLCTTLTDRCDYASQHILLLKLDPGSGETPATILDRIKQTIDGSKPGDTILFYFAGHGHRAKDDKTYLILPDTVPGAYEKTALALDDISNRLRQPDRPCFRMFDACHSGADVRDGAVLPDASGFVRAITHDPTGWVTLAACREDQYSVSDPVIGQGIFTHYVCDFIQSAKMDEEILPELLKIGIVDKVYGHAKKLGNSQTPTLNASISGNVSLATRRADSPRKQEGEDNGRKEATLQERIAKLRAVPDIITTDFLHQALQHLVEATRKELEAQCDLATDISVGSPISASKIPDGMQRDIVVFAQRQGLHSRHELRRWEEEVEESQPLWGSAAVLASLFPSKKRKHVHYDIWQSASMPESANMIELAGDGRCVPGVKILVYVIPLQLKVCLLVSAFRQGWPPNEDELELLCHSYNTLKPGNTPTHDRGLAPFAVKRIVENLRQFVARRVNELEKELQEEK
jgi:hypothetical protein